VRVGVFGGEFDPPHVGHLVIAQEARYRLELDRLLIVPTASPPHRPRSRVPAEIRLRMAEAAFAGEPVTDVSRIELDRSGPSYTVDTLEALAGPGVELFLVLGADQLAAIERWHRPDRVRELAQLTVAGRPGVELPAGADILLENLLMDVSSTEIRRRVAAGAPVRHLVPDAVVEVLRAEGLYTGGP
jgi:nicotinate-nucleotide adenylyltransferase